MPFNTRNPIPSGDLRDLDDNARNIDTWANDKTKVSHPDRFGVQRYTWHGIEQKALLDLSDAVADATAEAGQYRDQALDAKNAAQAAAMMSGFSKYADTLAQLESGIGTNYIEGDVVMVFEDESRGDSSSIYKVESGVAVFKNVFDKTRQDLLSFTGNISADAEWSDVPAHSDPAFDVQAQALGNRTEWVKNKATFSFPSRDDFAASMASDAIGSAEAGSEVVAGGFHYKKVPGSTAIPDLPGYEPSLGFVTPEHFGAKKDANASDGITKALYYAAERGVPFKFIGDYQSSPVAVDIAGSSIRISSDGFSTISTLDTDSTKTWPPFVLRGRNVSTTGLSVSAPKGSRLINLSSAEYAKKEYDYFLIRSRLIEGDHRYDSFNSTNGCECQYVSPESATASGEVKIKDQLFFDFENRVIARGTARAGSATSLQLAPGTLKSSEVLRFKIKLTGGAGAGQFRWIVGFDEATQTASISDPQYEYTQPDFSPIPNATTTYEIVSEVSVNVIHPIENVFVAGGIHFKRTHQTGVISSGLAVQQVRNLDIRCDVSGCSDNSIRVTNFYHAKVNGSKVAGANYAGSGGSGRGYGVLFDRGYFAEADGVVASNCRTGLDAVNGVSILVRNGNKVFGGGLNYQGIPMFPAGDDIRNKGLSTHANVVFVKDDNNVVVDCSITTQPRGLRYVGKGFQHFGSCRELVRIAYCRDVEIDGLSYDSGSPMSATDSVFSKSDDRAVVLPQCVALTYHRQMIDGSSLRIKNADAKAINGPVVLIDDVSGSDVSGRFSIELRRNRVSMLLSASYPVAESVKIEHPSVATMRIVDLIDDDNEYTAIDPENITPSKPDAEDKLHVFRRLAYSQTNRYELDGWRVLKIQNNSVARIPVNNSTLMSTPKPSYLDVVLVGSGGATSQGYFKGVVHSGGWLDQSHGPFFSDAVGTAMTGSSGPSGSVNLGFSSGDLYVENRSGTWRLVLVKIS